MLSEIKTFALPGWRAQNSREDGEERKAKGQRTKEGGGGRGKEGGGGGERRQFELFKVLALNFRG